MLPILIKPESEFVVNACQRDVRLPEISRFPEMGSKVTFIPEMEKSGFFLTFYFERNKLDPKPMIILIYLPPAMASPVV